VVARGTVFQLDVLYEADAGELPASVLIKEIAIACTNVLPRSRAAPARQYELTRHEFAVVLADRARSRAKIGQNACRLREQ
jgi:hypothetical protein